MSRTSSGSDGRRTWPRTRRRGGLVGLLFGLSVLSATALYAHLALRTTSPAENERLNMAPETLRLEFTEPVELPLSMIVLTGPRGVPVSVGPLRAGESPEVVLADIIDPLTAGSYRVEWQAVGRDAHPMRGEYTFEIEVGAEGLANEDIVTPHDTGSAAPPAFPRAPTFSVQSPLYAVVRWLTYTGIVGGVGAVAFALLFGGSIASPAGINDRLRRAVVVGAAGVGIFATCVLAVALPLRLQAQSHALFGAGITVERFELLRATPWGLAWLLEVGGAVLLLVGLFIARSGRRVGWLVGIPAVAAIVGATAWSGHAAAVDRVTGVAIAADALHVLGVGVWIGALLVLLLVGVPLVRREPEATRRLALAGLVHTFSPVALGAAGVVLATGAFASFLHLTSVSDLWQTGYGRLLLAKLLLVAIVFAMGAYNWRRTRPRLSGPEGEFMLVRGAGAELAAAVVAIGLTAVLVAVPPPAQTPDTTSNDITAEP